VPGWCYASKDRLGTALGFSRRSVHRIIDRLKVKKIVEVDSETGYLRTTELWRRHVEIIKDRVFGDG